MPAKRTLRQEITTGAANITTGATTHPTPTGTATGPHRVPPATATAKIASPGYSIATGAGGLPGSSFAPPGITNATAASKMAATAALANAPGRGARTTAGGVSTRR